MTTKALCVFISCLSLNGLPSGEEFSRLAVRDLFLPSGAPTIDTKAVNLVGTVVWAKEDMFVLRDETGAITLNNYDHYDVHPGDRIIARCNVSPCKDSVYLNTTEIQKIGHKPLPSPKNVTCDDIRNGKFDFEQISLSGVVTDEFRDEIDANFRWLIISSGFHKIMVAIPCRHGSDIPLLRNLIDAEVTILGCCLPMFSGYRQFLNTHIEINSIEDIKVTKKPPADPFQAPTLELSRYLPPHMPPHRHNLSGRVLAVYGNDRLILECAYDHHLEVHLLAGQPLPKPGNAVTVSGFPECNAFYARVTKALVRVDDDRDQTIPSSAALSLQDIISPKNPNRIFNPYAHGKVICLRGTVRSVSGELEPKKRFCLELENLSVSIKTSPEFQPPQDFVAGCIADITGICLMQTLDDSSSGFSRITGFSIVPRNGTDYHIVSRPPWWTPARLLSTISILIMILGAIVLWNIALRRQAARRGRELFREQLGHVTADLRTEERTRLAVELHDTLAQNLTGVSMEIEAANDLRSNAPKAMLDHLGIAAKALRSCRDELRNCLWDLRSQALEERDLTKAVLRTLQPHVNDSQLAVRFNVPRARLSDNPAHALLRVIRELVINAIRHGNASSIKVAGTIDQGKLLCSVSDNGCGFDLETAPGVLQGHFGLQGVRERIDEIGGTFEISSTPGQGTKAVITLNAPTEDHQ